MAFKKGLIFINIKRGRKCVKYILQNNLLQSLEMTKVLSMHYLFYFFQRENFHDKTFPDFFQNFFLALPLFLNYCTQFIVFEHAHNV